MTVTGILSYVYDQRSEVETLLVLREQGACVGWPTEWFFPARGSRADRARAICATCPVRALCLTSVLERRDPNGVWGGTAEKDRRPLQAMRRRGVPIERIVEMVLAGELDEIMEASRSRGRHMPDEDREAAIRGAVAVLTPVVRAMAGRRGRRTLLEAIAPVESLSEAIDRYAPDVETAYEAARLLGLAA